MSQTQVQHSTGTASRSSSTSSIATQATAKAKPHDALSSSAAPIKTKRGTQNTLKWYPSTTIFRAIVVLFFAVLVARQDAANAVVTQVWIVCRNNYFFKHDSFEPFVATFSFGVWVWLWYFIDELSLKFPFLHQFVISPAKRTFDEHKKKNALRSGVAYMFPLLLFDALYPRRALPEAAPAALGLIGGVAMAVWLYDLLFFPIHLCMHKVKALRSIHHRHHAVGRPLVSAEVLRHGFIDGTLQVICNIVALNLLSLHPMTRAVYNVVVTYMLTEEHSGFDMPWMLHRVVPFGILGGPVKHEVHHMTGRNHYQQFFTYLDWMMGYYA